MKRSPMPARKTPLRGRARATKAFRCERCGSLFRRRVEWQPRNATGAVLCSSCSHRDRATGRVYAPRRRVDYVCEQCGAAFWRHASYRGSPRFCTRKCYGEWQRANPRPWVGEVDNSGEKNGRFVHGRRVGDNVAGKKKVRRVVIERDGDWCLLCGMPPPGLHLHRVIYGSQGGVYEPANCVQLCLGHHSTVHGNKRVWLPLLLAYLDEDKRAVALRALRAQLSD